jgi:hypothetical protein
MIQNFEKNGEFALHSSMNFEKILLYAILAAGVLLALVQYFFNRSLWLDEAMLAISIVTVNATDLLKPLKFDQVAPILFLQPEKLFSQLIPNSEMGLRLFPLISYLVALFAVSQIIRILFSNIYIQIVTLAFFVFNSALIYYSNEAKQYMTDVMVLSVVYYLILITYKIPRNKHLLLTVVGVFSIFLSNVSVIILFSAGIYWFIQEFRKTKFLVFIWVFGSWGMAFGFYYFFFILGHPARAVMLDYWKGANAFLPLNPIDPALYLFLFEKTQIILGVLSNSKSVILGMLFGILVFLGFLNTIIKRKNKAFLMLFLLPLIIHLILSAFQFYPFDKRLILYMIPNFIIVLGYSVDLIAHFFSNYLSTIRLRIFTVVLACFIGFLFFHKEYPIEKEELKKSMDFLYENISQDDKIYVYYGASNAFEYYQLTNYLKFENELLIGTANKQNKPEYINEVSLTTGTTWLLFSHDVDNEEEYIVTQLQLKGYEELKSFHAKGSSTYLFNLKD